MSKKRILSLATVCLFVWGVGTVSSFADIVSDLAFYASFDNGDLVADVNTHADWAKTPQLATGASNSAASKLGAGAMYVDDNGANGTLWRVGTFYNSGTVSFWFKPDGWVLENTGDTSSRRDLASITYGSNASNQDGLVAGSGQYSAVQAVRNSNYSASYIGKTGVSQGTDWTYITVVWSNSVVSKLYINGSETDITGNDQILAQSTEQLVIGNRKGADNSFGNESGGGWYDEVRLYSRALSDTDVAELYAIPEPATISLLVAGGIIGFLKNTRRH